MNGWTIEHAADMAALSEPRAEHSSYPTGLRREIRGTIRAYGNPTAGFMAGCTVVGCAWSTHAPWITTVVDRCDQHAAEHAPTSPWVRRAQAGTLPTKVYR